MPLIKPRLHQEYPMNSNRCKASTEHWKVLDRNCNYSAFNGRHYTPSDYSAVKCMSCGWVWRTKANYVGDLPDATPAERLK